jgi:transcription termination factor Rho
MDQVIFEEFKGTGNSELVLSRELADRRLWPAIDLQSSATRREELLLSDAALNVSHAMRRELSDMSPEDALSEVLGIMSRTDSNADLIEKAAARI